jgi:hypothetical protein
MILADVTAPRILRAATAATFATNATASVSFDTVVSGIKYDAAVIEAYIKPASATDVSAAWAVLRIEHSDDGTTWTSDSGNVGTTGTPSTSQFAIAVHNDTSNPQVTLLNFDGRGKGSKVRVVFQPPASTNNHTVQFLAKGYRPNVVPNSTTEMGVQAYGVSN